MMSNHVYESHDGLDEAKQMSVHEWVPRESKILDPSGNKIAIQPRPIGFVTDFSGVRKSEPRK